MVRAIQVAFLVATLVGLLVTLAEYRWAIRTRTKLRQRKIGGLYLMWATHTVREEMLRLIVLTLLLVPIASTFVRPRPDWLVDLSRTSLAIVPVLFIAKILLARYDRRLMEDEAASLEDR